MIFLFYVTSFCVLCINAYTKIILFSTTASPDSSIAVYLPVVIVAVLIFIILAVCYYFFNGLSIYKDYEVVDSDDINDNLPSSRYNPNEENLLNAEDTIFQPEIGIIENNKPDSLNLCGLENSNNECYMNCVVQALASSDVIINHLTNSPKLPESSRVSKILLKLINGLNSTDKTSNVKKNTKRLTRLVNKIEWEKVLQQDAFEFLGSITNYIHKESKIELPFKLEMVHKTLGLRIPEKIQYHMGLSLGLCGPYETSPGVHLDYLINEYLSATNIDEDKLKSTQIFFYKQSPAILLLHIQANKWCITKQMMIKPKYYVQYNKDMKLNLNIKSEINDKIFSEQVDYKLVAVINHTGDYLGGHYVTYRKLKNLWILANDTQMTPVQFNSNICPYILIYEKDEY